LLNLINNVDCNLLPQFYWLDLTSSVIFIFHRVDKHSWRNLKSDAHSLFNFLIIVKIWKLIWQVIIDYDRIFNDPVCQNEGKSTSALDYSLHLVKRGIIVPPVSFAWKFCFIIRWKLEIPIWDSKQCINLCYNYSLFGDLQHFQCLYSFPIVCDIIERNKNGENSISVRQTKRILKLIETHTVGEITVGVCCCVGLVAQTTLLLIRLSGECVCAI